MTAIDPRQTLKEKLPNKWAIVILGGPGRNQPGPQDVYPPSAS
jgi:hypothetical protein